MIQAFHRALQISASLGTCMSDPMYQGLKESECKHGKLAGREMSSTRQPISQTVGLQ